MAQARATTESLPVASDVQALAEACSRGVDDQQQVLEKYFKEDPDEEVVVGCPIPVNDFRKLQDPWLCSSECAKLASACLDWGFFQVGTSSDPLLICFSSSTYYIYSVLNY